MNRRRRAGTRALVVGLSVAAITCASAAAATPAFFLKVQAHLGPVAGTAAAGQFTGALVLNGIAGSKTPLGAVPRYGSAWRLTWTLHLPALGDGMTASLRIPAQEGTAPLARVLCTHCAARAKGTMTVTGSQALRIAGSHTVVVVRTGSAMLRGTVKVLAPIPVALAR